MHCTYTVPLAEKGLPFCTPRVAWVRREYPELAGTRVVPLEQLPPEQIARFFTDYYNEAFDARLQQLRDGFFDLAISTAIINADGQILAANLNRSQPGNPVSFLDLVLVHPDYRNGLLPLMMLEAAGNLAIARGLTHCVFEADAQHDPVVTHMARHCGCKPQWYRYRYAIQLQLCV